MGVPLIDSRFAPRELLELQQPTEPVLERPTTSRLMLILPDGQKRPIEERLSIGSAASNDVALEDGHLSRRHCVIEPIEGRMIIRDLASTNGTHVNGVRVTHAELRPGTLLTLGISRLRVTHDASRAATILGDSPAIERLRQQVTQLAGIPLPVLIHGETGTGKELVARALHDQSGRRGRFEPVNCGSIPRDLIESELFGHERGAFTGASTKHTGLFMQADSGTLFLDEIGELPDQLQTRLLRVLETGAIRPLGAAREIYVHVRIVAATHVDLERAVREGRFRRDLYYRLAAAVLTTPPLRARPIDIPVLAQQVLDEEAAQGHRCRLSDAAMERLMGHPWPGNVRELRNVLRRAVALGGAVLEPHDLKLEALRLQLEDDVVQIGGRTLQEIERDILVRIVRRCGGNQRAAAAELGMAASSLNDKLRRYRIDAASLRVDEPRRPR
jgi:DNA-binding NtrC family response regulator